ncbi:hypothetical protein DPMN_193001 [Dreissena polymorpha]|uniref:Uncharacterized protein n=1 Tax=Dreissena polymorpha TaxID=45954 RepID=A0A9D3Y367_DREPO|nr:hypothetical protein DPMN_193001 [Dreissena polymorpha]
MVNIKTNQDNTSSEVGTNDQILQAAGKAFDNLLSASADKISTHGDMFMDPRTILTIKSVNKKATHITQFLTEKTKRRRQNKRRGYVLSGSGKREETIVLKTSEDHPYLEIYIEDWGLPICDFLTIS